MDDAAATRQRVPIYRLYGEGAGAAEDFWLHCETIPERSRLHDWEIRPHRHPAFFQFLHISSGSGDALIENEWMSFGPRALIFIPPKAIHGFRFSRDIGGLVVTVMRDRLDALTAVDRVLRDFAARSRLIATEDPAERLVAASLERIGAELRGHAAAKAMVLEALVTTVLIDLARAAGASGETESAFADRDRQRIETLLQLVAVHFREHRPAGFYAERLGLSPAHLNRVLRAGTGHSLQELINRRLVEEAKRDLVFTFLPAQSVALKLGFSDPAYFSRFFRRHAGATPAAFRRSERARLKL